MALINDLPHVVDGNTIAYSTTKSNFAAALPSQQGLMLSFMPLKGAIRIQVFAYDNRQQSRMTAVGTGHATDASDFVEEFNLVPVQIQLFGSGNRLVQTWNTQQGWSRTDGVTFEYADPGPTAEMESWECHVTNTGAAPAQMNVFVSYVFSIKPLLFGQLPLVLLDHTYEVILNALTIRAEIDGDTVRASFGAELVRFFGASPPAILTTPLTRQIGGGVTGTGSLECVELDACSGKQLLEAMQERFQELDSGYAQALVAAKAQPPSEAALLLIQSINDNIRKNNDWRQDWEQKVHSDYLVIHGKATFTGIHLDRETDLLVGTIDVDIAEIEDALIHVYVAFYPAMEQCYALVLSPARVTGGLLEKAIGLGIFPDVNEVASDFLTPWIENAGPSLGRYLGEALGRLCGQNGVFLQVTADDSNWTVQYTAFPVEPSPGAIHTTGTPGDGGVLTTGTGSPGARRSAPTTTAPIIPQEFVVGPPVALARLDKIETIIVVMMENRSFDHMLGYLRQSRGPAYNGVTGGESNALVGRTQPVWLRKASDVVTPPTTQILKGPEHGFTHVPVQIADGAMSGFAQDYENSYTGNGEMVMTYYTGNELKTYDQLASSFCVCDQWFAAHPGPTWPNRWTTMSGSTPELENPANSDPRLGFLPQHTIFDLLSIYGIGWRVFESDLSLIRTYDRFRLDSTHVTPLRNRHDPTQDFKNVAARGELPPVVFVEPNFSDIPPLSSANDDLVPVDVRRGQNFVGEIFGYLKDSPQKDKMLFVLLYDEHGGFYDHVAPPGTKLGPAEFYDVATQTGKVPLIHPQGAAHLGVRVPAMVISPWVSAGSVCSQIFDHTSIIKTILLRHRNRFQDTDFTSFGPRVNQAAQVGMALDLDTPRSEWPTITRIERGADQRDNPGDRARQGVTLDDIHESLPSAFLPRPDSASPNVSNTRVRRI